MLKFKNYIFLVFLGLFFHIDSNAQIDKTFWFAVPDVSPVNNWNNGSNSYFRVGTFGKAATVTISQPAAGGTALAVQTIPANSSYSFALNTIFSTLVATGEDVIVNKGVLISSDELISVYFDSGVGNVNPDLFSLKGSNGLGNKFIITAGNFDTGYDTRHEAYVIATEDNTTISITPKVTIEGHLAGAQYTKVLNRGQVYIISSVKANSGTYVTAAQ